jgi:hypothetical protein
MARAFTPKVITANALLEGDVIYMTSAGKWSRSHGEAELFTNEAHGQLRLLEAMGNPNVVGAYLADAAESPAGPVPVHFREKFRTKGPSNYAHGKQEH